MATEIDSRRAASGRTRWLVIMTASVALQACGGDGDDVPRDAAATTARPISRVAADGPGLTDAQVAGIAVNLVALDTSFSARVRAASLEPEIARFAATLLADHAAIVSELRRQPAPQSDVSAEHELVREFRDAAAAARVRFDSLTGPLLDRAYLEREVSFHTALLAAFDETLIPSARQPELKTMLQNIRPAVEAHHRRARQLLAER